MVILFVICHLPRVLLDLHEVATLTEQRYCGPQRWTYTAVSLSHILLVIFCSAKLLIYCLISSQIKQEFIDMMRQARTYFWTHKEFNVGLSINLINMNLLRSVEVTVRFLKV